MKALSRFVARLSVVAAVACGGGAQSTSTAPAPRATSVEQQQYAAAGGDTSAVDDPEYLQGLMDRVFVQVKAVTEVALSAGDDCDLMAEKVDAWVDDNQADLDALSAEVSRVDPATQREYFEAKIDSEPEFGMDFMIAVSTCQDHPGASAAWKRFQKVVTR